MASAIERQDNSWQQSSLSSELWMGESSTGGEGKEEKVEGRLGIHLQHFLLFTPL